MAGVSDVAISKACRGRLADACVDRRVDVDHPAVVDYLAAKGSKPPPVSAVVAGAGAKEPAKRPGAARKPKAKPSPDARPDGDQTVDGEVPHEEMSLRELTDRFGTITTFKDWLDARKKLVDIREKDLKNAETEGELIDRELVRSHVFGAIESVNRRLLGDAPKTIARRLYAAAKSDMNVEAAEKIVREIISSQLKPVKVQAARALRSGKTPDDT